MSLPGLATLPRQRPRPASRPAQERGVAPVPSGAVAVALRNGRTAYLRPLRPGETAPIVAVFDQMSESARADRYLVGMARIPASMLTALADVDGQDRVAWVAEIAGQAVGIARYARTTHDPADPAETAEIAFEVVDDVRGQGLGGALVDAVTTHADAAGISRLVATATPSNAASRAVLHRLGLTTRILDGLLEAEGPLRLLDPARVDRAAVLAALCRAA